VINKNYDINKHIQNVDNQFHKVFVDINYLPFHFEYPDSIKMELEKELTSFIETKDSINKSEDITNKNIKSFIKTIWFKRSLFKIHTHRPL